MRTKILSLLISTISIYKFSQAQKTDPFTPDFINPKKIPGYVLVWNEEFNTNGKPDSTIWIYETGFIRNKELQWCQPGNAYCKDGLLVIEGRKQHVQNSNYDPESTNWRLNRKYANYTSACLKTKALKQWQYGRFEIRARIDTSKGSWPAIWTMGIHGEWPSNGEIDIMEFYRVDNVPTILANVAWGTDKRWKAKWDSEKKPLSHFTSIDPHWTKKFHVWRMDWNKDTIKLFLDSLLLNTTSLDQTLNADGSNPFTQPHFLLLNLAIGSNGGNPAKTTFPIKYEVDYIRIYKEK